MKILCKTQRFAGYLVAKLKGSSSSESELSVFLLHKDRWSKLADLFCKKWLSVESYLANLVFLRK